MKSYVTMRQLRLVGKAWEIRQQLHNLMQQGSGGSMVRLVDFLSSQTIHQSPHCTNTSPQQFKRPTHKELMQNKEGHVIPFPS